MSDNQLRLATLQALIYDNEASLSAISAKVDQLIAQDDVSPLVGRPHFEFKFIQLLTDGVTEAQYQRTARSNIGAQY